MTLDRHDAEGLDRLDPLAGFRDRFVVTTPQRIYADGNSLGRLPLETVERTQLLMRDWGERLVAGWEDWIELPVRVGERIGEVIGANPGETLACDSTTVNLYKLAWASLDLSPDRGVVLVDEHDFPTDRYVLEGIAASRGLELRRMASDPVSGPSADDVARAVGAGDVALIVLSHVSYRSGALADLTAITEAAHDAGALILWDLSHSAGAVSVGLAESGADLAVGCTYKYLNAGPGAPAFLFVRTDLQEQMRSPVWGWFGQRDQFAMGPRYEPASGIERFLAGNAARPRAHRSRGRRRADPRGGGRVRAREGPRADRAPGRTSRRAPRTARATVEHAAGSVAARRARLARTRRRVAPLPRADRARRRDPGLPPAGHGAARLRPSLQPLRRRLGHRRPAGAARGDGRVPRSQGPTRAGHMNALRWSRSRRRTDRPDRRSHRNANARRRAAAVKA
jgi:kynureninase